MPSAKRWDVLVPVKPLDRAKSRLLGLPRETLMRAFALDTLAACSASSAVHATYVVTHDEDLAAIAGCERLPDLGEGDLNRALLRAREQLPHDASIACLLGDLPCLRERELTAALEAVEGPGAVVADAAGTGSTLLAVPAAAGFTPRFGADSFAAHVEAGYAPSTLEVRSLRRDVDTADDLREAIALGVGPRTAEALRTHEGR
ncbi:2-phospho-L-lactate guanylyltransferase [Nocardioides mangrovicus]|uniref:Phosphoenolpyruvate guanylyltransferase n=1 Tax=Nocardioides mangrovicus TaxID=2478913 RepID=A0A3L8P7C3_9ACTN|nr:2-phospho-L-lactate guanylyltransferase [Nocardioides mangrovicus]RLV51151.1 2-phospho-L-lactate guanylyltransferase [Nocardioides mangrovicus]